MDYKLVELIDGGQIYRMSFIYRKTTRGNVIQVYDGIWVLCRMPLRQNFAYFVDMEFAAALLEWKKKEETDISQSQLSNPAPIDNLAEPDHYNSTGEYLDVDITEEESPPCSSWTDASTKLLLSLYNDLHPKVGKTVKLRTKKKMFEAIKVEMNKSNYHFSSSQIENRWKTLERSFKRKTENNKKTGRSKEELTECLAERSHVFPEYTLGREGEGKTKQEILKDAGIDFTPQQKNNEPKPGSSNVSGCSNSKLTIQKSSPAKSKSIAVELRQINNTRQASHNEKLDAYKQRTAEIKRKNDLFERLIVCLEK